MLLNSLFHPKQCTLFEFISLSKTISKSNKVFSLFCVFVFVIIDEWWWWLVLYFLLFDINVFWKGFRWENYIGWILLWCVSKVIALGANIQLSNFQKISKMFLPTKRYKQRTLQITFRVWLTCICFYSMYALLEQKMM